MWSSKCIFITGGTGSFGNAVLKYLLKTDIEEIRIFSRDEMKQDSMRQEYRDDRIKFYIGDVRSYDSINNAMRNVDYVFHAAALKQVPSCEFHPLEAIKTNALGTDNVIEVAIRNNVKKVVCLSTDKAVYPINAMGISKAMMEKIMVAKSRHLNDSQMVICGTRYGNVMASRGSVIPLFVQQIKMKQPITITDPKMTRFMMSLGSAVDLVMYAFNEGRNGDIFVQKAPAVTMGNLAKTLLDIFDIPKHPVKVIGTRHGEKLYETLLTREEKFSAEDSEGYFRIIPDQRSLNYDKFFQIGEKRISDSEDYNSHNTMQLSLPEIKELLLGLDFVQQHLKDN